MVPHPISVAACDVVVNVVLSAYACQSIGMTILIVIDDARTGWASSVFVSAHFIARAVSGKLVPGLRARVELDAVKLGLAHIMMTAALLLAATGCGEVQGQSYAPMQMSASKTVIYIYRPWHFLGSGNSPMVTCGHDSIELDAGGYHTFYDEPGQISCSAAAPGNPQLKFSAETDTAYYVREEYSANGQVQLTLVDADMAKSEISYCKLQSVAQAPSAQ
jgi:hypothetical protein